MSPRTFGSAGYSKPTERVMIFIDGGYIRKVYKELFRNDEIDYGKLIEGLLGFYNSYDSNPFRADLIRAYYYDAIVDPEEKEKFNNQKEYFKKVSNCFFITIRLGKLLKSGEKGYRQKGVDILISIDALTMAYRNYYDTGVFFVGDSDFIPLIEAVKETGKKTWGFCYGEEYEKGKVKSEVPNDLLRSFDVRTVLPKQILEKWRKNG